MWLYGVIEAEQAIDAINEWLYFKGAASSCEMIRNAVSLHVIERHAELSFLAAWYARAC